ncbi:unnamed protein product [Amoebophrya sp. A120]|nr:unnamed protein product [Amoebophrya sp. A120]|eukprot:GSA120T00000649001.1
MNMNSTGMRSPKSDNFAVPYNNNLKMPALKRESSSPKHTRSISRQYSKESSENFLLSEFDAPWPATAAESEYGQNSGLRSPKYLLSDYRQKLESYLREYFLGGDFQAFVELVFALRCDGFNDILVAKIFRTGVDITPTRSADHPLSWENLLKGLLQEQVISQTELLRGLYGFCCSVSDLEKDVPNASILLLNFFANVFTEEAPMYSGTGSGDQSSGQTTASGNEDEYDYDLNDSQAGQSTAVPSLITPTNNQRMLVVTTRSGTKTRGRVPAEIFYRFPEDVLRKHGSPTYVAIADELRDHKKVLQKVLRDFIRTKDYERVKMNLMDLESQSLFCHEFVKRAILMSLDFTLVDQKAVCGLLQRLRNDGLVRSEDLQHGIALVLGRLDDVLIDVPNAKRMVADIFVQFVKMEIIPATLLKKEQQLQYGMLAGVEVLTEVLHKTPEYSRQIWNGIDERSLFQEMELAIEEHFDSYDCEEVARILTELHLTRELKIKFLRRLLLYSIEKRDVHTGLNLISYLHGNGSFLAADAKAKMQLVEDSLESIRCDSDELIVDQPDIEEATSYVVDQMFRYGLISGEYYRLDQQYMV